MEDKKNEAQTQESWFVRASQVMLLLMASMFYVCAVGWLSWRALGGGAFERVISLVVGVVLVCVGAATQTALWSILLEGHKPGASQARQGDSGTGRG